MKLYESLSCFKESLLESYKYGNLSTEQQTNIFNIFRDSYIKSTGTAWNRDKFDSRAYNWLFFGDENGFLTVRIQRSGFYKLTGCAGNSKSILKGIHELTDLNVPVWGVMTKNIADMLVKKFGYIQPSAEEIKKYIKLIPREVFGEANITVNDDGTLDMNYSDTGQIQKVFIGNKIYIDTLHTMSF